MYQGLSGGERTSRKTYYEIKPQELKAGLKTIPYSAVTPAFRHLIAEPDQLAKFIDARQIVRFLETIISQLIHGFCDRPH